jgi:hypothetical protein
MSIQIPRYHELDLLVVVAFVTEPMLPLLDFRGFENNFGFVVSLEA